MIDYHFYDLDELIAVEEIGGRIAQSVLNYFADETNSIIFFPKYKQLFPFQGQGFF